MLRIALAQINPVVGDIEGNCRIIGAAIEKSVEAGAHLTVFPELALCGYPPLDLLDYAGFTEQCVAAVKILATKYKHTAFIIGAPSENPVPEGKNIFNSAFVCQNGEVRYIINKALLPNYDVFDEYRYFEPGPSTSCITVNGMKIALTVCEDIWDLVEDPMYTRRPMDQLAKESPVLAINIAASPFDSHHREDRIETVRKNALTYGIPFFYVNHAGAQTDVIFDGGSMVVDKTGEICLEGKYFSEDLLVAEVDAEGNISATKNTTNKQPGDTTERIYHALVLGIQEYFRKSGFSKALLGLSGGIDSAVVAALATAALGKENVHGILMPSQFSSEHSVEDAVALANNLGITHTLLPIKETYEAFLKTLESPFRDLPFNLAEENLQARCRGVLLMAWSNKFGHVLLNTTNKSEAAVGYGTLYGDMCGGIAVLADVYKTEVYRLARFINKQGELIPENTLVKPPSAELRPGQKDADSLPEYDLLDTVLHAYIEEKLTAAKIKERGFDPALVDRVVTLVNRNEYKRKQMAPVLRVSSKSFGLSRRMPIVGRY